jgi:hypothetical protein
MSHLESTLRDGRTTTDEEISDDQSHKPSARQVTLSLILTMVAGAWIDTVSHRVARSNAAAFTTAPSTFPSKLPTTGDRDTSTQALHAAEARQNARDSLSWVASIECDPKESYEEEYRHTQTRLFFTLDEEARIDAFIATSEAMSARPCGDSAPRAWAIIGRSQDGESAILLMARIGPASSQQPTNATDERPLSKILGSLRMVARVVLVPIEREAALIQSVWLERWSILSSSAQTPKQTLLLFRTLSCPCAEPLRNDGTVTFAQMNEACSHARLSTNS